MSAGLISGKKLIELMAAEPVQVVDARRKHEYAAGHIPGAVSLSWEEFCADPPPGASKSLKEPGYWGLLADPVAGDAALRLSKLGLKSDKPLVVYANSMASKGREGRIAWMLLYLGAKSVLLLDGGINAWIEEGGLWERTDPTLSISESAATFKLKLDHRRRVLFNELKEAYQNNDFPLLIDTRSAEEYRGDCYEYQPRKGRMPNSVLLPFNLLFCQDGKFKSVENFIELLPSDLKDHPKKASYCEVGVRAATFALLHEIHTGEIIAVYDGSIMEWALDPLMPIF